MAVFGLAGIAVHAATVSQSATAPSANIVAGSDPTPNGSGTTQFNKSPSQDRFGGVTFSLSAAADVSAVTFYLDSFNAAALGASASISLVEFDSLSSESITYPYTTVFSETVTMPAELTAGSYITFGFSAPASLEAGNYGIVFRWLGTGAQRSVNFRSAATSGEGTTFRTTLDGEGELITQFVDGAANRELVFLVQGASQVPEPATFAGLAGVVVLTGAVCARRGRRARD